MIKKTQCNHCGYIFDCEDDQEFGYCPCCEDDKVEFNKRNELRVGDVVKFADNYDQPRLWSVESVTKHRTPVGEELEFTFKEIEIDNNYTARKCKKRVIRNRKYYDQC